VIKKGDEFFIYGDKNGCGRWCFSAFDPTEKFDWNDLPFLPDTMAKIERAHPMFNDLLANMKLQEVHVFPTTLGKLSSMKENLFKAIRGTGFFIPFEIREQGSAATQKEGTVTYTTYQGSDQKYFQYSGVIPGGEKIDVRSKVALDTNPNADNKWKVLHFDKNRRLSPAEEAKIEAANAVKRAIEEDMMTSHLIPNYMRTRAKLRTPQGQYRHRLRQAEILKNKRNFLSKYSISAGEKFERDNIGLHRFLVHEHKPDSHIAINEAFIRGPEREEKNSQDWRQRNSLPADQHTIKTPYLDNQREGALNATHLEKLTHLLITDACDKAKLYNVMRAIKAQIDIFRNYNETYKHIAVFNHDFDEGTQKVIPREIRAFLYALYYLLPLFSEEQLEQNFCNMFDEEFASDRYDSLIRVEQLQAVAGKILTLSNIRRAIREQDLTAIKYLLTYLPKEKIAELGQIEINRLKQLVSHPSLLILKGDKNTDEKNKKLLSELDLLLKNKKLDSALAYLEQNAVSVEILLLNLSSPQGGITYERINEIKRLAFLATPSKLAFIAYLDNCLGQWGQWKYFNTTNPASMKPKHQINFQYHATLDYKISAKFGTNKDPSRYTSVVRLAVDTNDWETVLKIASYKASHPDNADLGYAILKAADLGKWTVVEELLKCGVSDFSHVNAKGEKLVHLIIQGNKLSLLKKIHEKDRGTISDPTTITKELPIKMAERLNRDAIVKFLKDHYATTSLTIQLSRADILKLAQSKKPHANSIDSIGAQIHSAAGDQDWTSVKKFFEYGVTDINWYYTGQNSPQKGWSVMHCVCAGNQVDIVKDIISRFGVHHLLTSNIVENGKDKQFCFTPIEVVADLHLTKGKMQGRLDGVITVIKQNYPNLKEEIISRNRVGTVKALYEIGVIDQKACAALLERVKQRNLSGDKKGELQEMEEFLQSKMPSQAATTTDLGRFQKSGVGSASASGQFSPRNNQTPQKKETEGQQKNYSYR